LRNTDKVYIGAGAMPKITKDMTEWAFASSNSEQNFVLSTFVN